MIRRALSNLLSNAIRYAPRGRSVTVLLNLVADKASVCIANPGPIITPEHLTHIFERFYRPDSSRQRSSEGSGLGLAIVKTIVEAHGGRVSASSTADATQFEVVFPAAQRSIR
ncbi:GHKL domain-containing protein [Pusillimonas sp. MFBS29]|nr:ATP-binding protein [Pusillimonas sp. MFBS29]MCC2597768.1 GHKL domain-containing protein [Pusillimonas sp. MFBS29]